MSLIKVPWLVLRVKNLYFRSSSDPSGDCCRRGKAEVRIFDFKTTRSEFQKASLTGTERSKAELRIYNLKKDITSPELVPSICVR